MSNRGVRTCAWCVGPIPERGRMDSVFCGQRCRQRSYRLRRSLAVIERAAQPMRMAYADPPFPGCAWMYRDQPSYAGEVDHAELIASLGAYDGWALSTSADALRDILPLCPRTVYVAPWIKPVNAAPATRGKHNAWEPLIVQPGRRMQPGFRDWLMAAPARLGGSNLVGRKPLAFCGFLFQQLGLLVGDELVDLFPGSGTIASAWRDTCRSSTGDTSDCCSDDASGPASGELSHEDLGNEPSFAAACHASPCVDACREYSGDGSPAEASLLEQRRLSAEATRR